MRSRQSENCDIVNVRVTANLHYLYDSVAIFGYLHANTADRSYRYLAAVSDIWGMPARQRPA